MADFIYLPDNAPEIVGLRVFVEQRNAYAILANRGWPDGVFFKDMTDEAILIDMLLLEFYNDKPVQCDVPAAVGERHIKIYSDPFLHA